MTREPRGNNINPTPGKLILTADRSWLGHFNPSKVPRTSLCIHSTFKLEYAIGKFHALPACVLKSRLPEKCFYCAIHVSMVVVGVGLGGAWLVVVVYVMSF